MRPSITAVPVCARAVASVALFVVQLLATGSYASTDVTAAPVPSVPPITYRIPFTTPADAPVRPLGIDATVDHTLPTGSYAYVVVCVVVGQQVSNPPATYSWPLIAPTAACARGAGSAGSAVHVSATGLYTSKAPVTAPAMQSALMHPPTTYSLPLITSAPAYDRAVSAGALAVHVCATGS